ncbi:uncharacterized protein TrAFT101_009636 [Trichoderma asperellum]|uniref:uncharacterized protein n=1 Tax=Trichoderma asperellum TaxID=101201 RepID=UPI0033217C89|nr:hypothetical protein TrAFT101_009636 [Trichoderma asperellum]
MCQVHDILASVLSLKSHSDNRQKFYIIAAVLRNFHVYMACWIYRFHRSLNFSFRNTELMISWDGSYLQPSIPPATVPSMAPQRQFPLWYTDLGFLVEGSRYGWEIL